MYASTWWVVTPVQFKFWFLIISLAVFCIDSCSFHLALLECLPFIQIADFSHNVWSFGYITDSYHCDSFSPQLCMDPFITLWTGKIHILWNAHHVTGKLDISLETFPLLSFKNLLHQGAWLLSIQSLELGPTEKGESLALLAISLSAVILFLSLGCQAPYVEALLQKCSPA